MSKSANKGSLCGAPDEPTVLFLFKLVSLCLAVAAYVIFSFSSALSYFPLSISRASRSLSLFLSLSRCLSPSRFSFLVENVSGSSWNSGRGRHVLEVTFGGGLTGVCRMCGVDEDRGNDFCGGVCGSTTDSPLNIITTCNLLNVKYNHNMN